MTTTDPATHVGEAARPSGLTGIPLLATDAPPQTKREFTSDQEVRWCPGCGDYAILAAVQSFLPELGLKRENITFVSGIGCSSRFPYYLDTMACTRSTVARPRSRPGSPLATDQNVWVVPGDATHLHRRQPPHPRPASQRN